MREMPFLLPDLETLAPAALKAMICLQHRELLSHSSQIERLELLIAKLRRIQVRPSSEKVERQIEQLELKLEELQANQTELLPEPPPQTSTVDRKSTPRKNRALPEHLPREVHTHLAYEESCSVCGLAEEAWRRYLRNAGVPAGELQGRALGSSQDVLRNMRSHRAGTGAFTTNERFW